MNKKRPAINYPMCWLCKFQIGRETEEVVFMTDDFDTVIKEYEKMKVENPNTPVIFVDHKLVEGERELQGIVNALGVEAQRLDGRVVVPVINADEANAHPGRVRHMANGGRLENTNTLWMREHNAHIAERMLKAPPEHKV